MKKLREAAHYVTEKIDVSSLKTEEYITTNNMIPNRGGVFDCESLPKASRVTRYEPGDILISNIRPYFKKIWYSDKISGCSNDVIVFRTNDKNWDKKFLYYVLSQDSFFDFMMAGSNGTKMPRGDKKTIPEFLIPDFDINKQIRISDILSAYDDLIENNKKQIKLLEEAAQRLYKEWFVDLHFPGYEDVEIVDGIPEGWTSGVLEDVAINSGKKEKKEKRNNYNYYLPIDCIPKKSLGYIQVNDVSLAKSSLIGFQKGDILFGAMRPYFHKVVVARDKGLTRSTCFVLNAKEPSYWSYIAMLLFAKDTVDYATQISVGTTMPYVRWKDMKNMTVVIPDKGLAKRFNKQFEPINDNIASLSEQIILLQQARDRLLPKLMNGEIEV